MSRYVRIPKYAKVKNAVIGLGVDMKDGGLTVLGAVIFLASVIAHRQALGITAFLICYVANRYYLSFKKSNLPGWFPQFLYKHGIGSYSRGLSGKTKRYFGDNKAVWAGSESHLSQISDQHN